jgi:hypothetical protein
MNMTRIKEGKAKYYLIDDKIVVQEKWMTGQEFITANKEEKESGSKRFWKAAEDQD